MPGRGRPDRRRRAFGATHQPAVDHRRRELSQRFGLPALHLANDFAAAALGAVTAPAVATADPAGRRTAGDGAAPGGRCRHRAGHGHRPAQGGRLAHRRRRRWACRLRSGRRTAGGAVALPRSNGMAASPGNGWFPARASPPSTNSSTEHLLHPGQIAARAAADAAGAAARSLDLFLAAYGAFAGDMALACLARGGVFLAGGIAASLLPAAAASGFLAAFNAKAEHAGDRRAHAGPRRHRSAAGACVAREAAAGDAAGLTIVNMLSCSGAPCHRAYSNDKEEPDGRHEDQHEKQRPETPAKTAERPRAKPSPTKPRSRPRSRHRCQSQAGTAGEARRRRRRPCQAGRPRAKKPGGVPAEQRRNYIEMAAYYIAERRGFAPGNPLEDWVQAEAEIDRLLAEGRLGG
jgi:hypothetical protein